MDLLKEEDISHQPVPIAGTTRVSLVVQAVIGRSNLAGHKPTVVAAYSPLSVLISFQENTGRNLDTWIRGSRRAGLKRS